MSRKEVGRQQCQPVLSEGVQKSLLRHRVERHSLQGQTHLRGRREESRIDTETELRGLCRLSRRLRKLYVKGGGKLAIIGSFPVSPL